MDLNAQNIKLIHKGGFWQGNNHVYDFECKSSAEIKEAKNEEILFNLLQKKQQCEAIGFTPKTEKFADCVLRLVELDIKNQQSNNMIASQNKSESDKFMSNALLNLGQQLMQPNSNIYNSNTRNCSVRKSFGNTSTVTCY